MSAHKNQGPTKLAGKTYWIVGASEGLGRAVAERLDQEGAQLVLSARSTERLVSLARDMAQARVVPVDVTDLASVEAAVLEAGTVDGLIYMAGTYEPMAAQNWDAAQVEQMADTNYMGALRVIGRVLPAMVKRDAGHIVITGSLTGYRGLPGEIGYGASKSALRHLAEDMRCDLWQTGVKVQLVMPGFIRTRLTDKNDFAMPGLMDPEEAAEIIVTAMKGRAFKRDFPRWFSWVFRAGRLLPQGLYQRLFAG
ncbi:putative oxidoreductase [Aquimixticola soesokkakensis]|uniref:Putative oxidoreductase n=1 Tax=Aquimixticola soesokkakensis TaxID=1519096 RepID=A0A1Y5RE91_9RHOB|nr:SDR family NAD(P)-dependent oxidoreductase [Aquimixticola soesokkakensis]SLN15440.1 putative oxidoreductase [Aquimixticola soesokkakensis]